MGLLKVEKCKLDEIVPKKPKFARRRPSLFLRDGSNGFSRSENDEELEFLANSLRRAFFDTSVKVSLYHTL
jgi:hypothetical protein